MQVLWEDVAAIQVGPELVCADCATEEEMKEMTADDVVTQDDIDRDDDKLTFCDRCKARL